MTFSRLATILVLTVGLIGVHTTVAQAGNPKTPVWLGAPFAGKHGGGPGIPDTRPGVHGPYSGQWAADLYAPKGTSVKVYAAPKDSRLSSQVTAKVIGLSAVSCGAAYGGYNVKVGFYHSGTLVGWALYTHVSSLKVKYGQKISRWGTTLGVVGSYKRSNCWQVSTAAGHHIHFEARNATGTSCYRAVSKGQRFSVSEYIGYIGRNDTGSCASGA